VEQVLLYGEFELSIDEKNRISVPSDVRRAIDPKGNGEPGNGEVLFMVIGLNRKPWLWPEKSYQRIVFQAQQDLTPDEDQLAFDQLNFAMASKGACDRQGRLLLPEKLLRRTGTGKEVTLVGVRNHLEIWNRQDWETRFETLLNTSSEVALRARLAQRQQVPMPPAQGSSSRGL